MEPGGRIDGFGITGAVGKGWAGDDEGRNGGKVMAVVGLRPYYRNAQKYYR